MSSEALLYAFDLLELDGQDLRREPLEMRKATLASILRKARHGVRLNEHLEHPAGLAVFQHADKLGLEGIVSKRRARAPAQADRRTGSKSRTQRHLLCGGRPRRTGDDYPHPSSHP